MQPIKVPATSNEQYGGLEVTYSSTKLNSLSDAFLHLLDYPYECNEQIASRILAVVALYDVLEVFGKVTSYEASQAITRDLEKLAKNQNSNGILYLVFFSTSDANLPILGGFGFWKNDYGEDVSWPYLRFVLVQIFSVFIPPSLVFMRLMR